MRLDLKESPASVYFKTTTTTKMYKNVELEIAKIKLQETEEFHRI